MMQTAKWLVNTDAGLAVRIAAGVIFFLAMAIVDVYRQGRLATRWREYLILLTAVAVALLYGALNDQITSRISWEYFYYGKDLQRVLGPHVPPDSGRVSWEAAKIGMQATWTAGLIIGVAILLANNPRKDLPRLSFGRLLGRMWIVILCCVACAALLGTIGYHGGLVWFSSDFGEMVAHDDFRPYRFMAVYGVHLGGYVGGGLGTLWAVRSILIERRKIKDSPSLAQ
jgi:hypothetical protein